MLSLEDECPIHALSGALALRTFGDISSQEELQPHEVLAWAVVSQHQHVVSTLKATEADLVSRGSHGTTKALRRCFYDTLVPSGIVRPTALLCRVQERIPGDELSASQIQTANLSWLSPQYGLPLHDCVIQCAIHNRLSCPMFLPSQRCQYVPKSSGVQCCAPLGVRGKRTGRCCNALALARHHAVRDALHVFAADAGYHSTIEQVIVTRSGAPQLEPVGNGAIAEDPGYSKTCDVLMSLPN